MRRSSTYFFIAVITVAVLASCKQNNVLPSLKETYFASDKNPFGAYVAHNLLQQLYSNNTIHDEKKRFEKTWQDISDTAALYINISRNLVLPKADKNAMLSYVSAGNSLFISSEYIDEDLLTDLKCSETRDFNSVFGSFSDMHYTEEMLDTNMYDAPRNFGYFYLPFTNYFKFDPSYATIMGKNENGKPDFIIVYYGKGRFYLHCEPRAFSNYFLLQKENYRYLQNAFGLTHQIPQHVYWDDYYNKHNVRNKDDNSNTLLGFLLKFPSMAWAFWLTLVMLLVYVLLGSKRRQRIVKIIPPNTNTTVAFTETVGRLYYLQKNNKNIADKMIMYFLERIRNQYFLNTNQLNDVFLVSLSRKSSVPQDTVNALFATIATIQQSTKVAHQQLLLLNQQIENFYKNNS